MIKMAIEVLGFLYTISACPKVFADLGKYPYGETINTNYKTLEAISSR